MLFSDILDLAADVAQVSDALWILIRDTIIPDENARRAMLREAFTWELTCGRAGKVEWAQNARKLRKFLNTAPVGLDLSYGLTVESNGSVSAYPNPSLMVA